MSLDRSQCYLTLKTRDIARVSGVEVLSILTWGLQSIRTEVNTDILPDVPSEDRVSVFLERFGWQRGDFDGLKKENVGENPLGEIAKTCLFLEKKFSHAVRKLWALGVTPEALTNACIRFLAWKVIESGRSERRLKNGNVVSLTDHEPDRLGFQMVPYYAFACTNVALDDVYIQTNDGSCLSLREIDHLLWSTDDSGQILLPNSLRISACLLCKWDGGKAMFIGQDRNNANTLTQRRGLVSAASGAISQDILATMSAHKNALHLSAGVSAEIEEELGIDTTLHGIINIEDFRATVRSRVASTVKANRTAEAVRVSLLMGTEFLFGQMRDTLRGEIGCNESIQIIPVALVMEEYRRNPEVLFLAITGKTFTEIETHYATAEDRWESKKLVGVGRNDIETSLANMKR